MGVKMAKLDAAQRKSSATVYTNGTPRFPMPDLAHARLALAMLPRAKGLTNAQRAAITARANRMLGRS